MVMGPPIATAGLEEAFTAAIVVVVVAAAAAAAAVVVSFTDLGGTGSESFSGRVEGALSAETVSV